MRRLDRDRSKKVSDENNAEDIDDLDDFGLTNGLDDFESPSPPKAKQVSTAKQRYSTVSFDDEEDDEDEVIDRYYGSRGKSTPSSKSKSKSNDKSNTANKVIVVLVVCLMLGICFVFYKLTAPVETSGGSTQTEDLNPTLAKNNPSTQTATSTVDNNKNDKPSSGNSTNDASAVGGTLVKEDDSGNPVEIVDNSTNNDASTNVNVGVPNFNTNTNMTSDTSVENYNNFVKSVDGKDVEVDYTVSRIDTVSDFVNYTKHRGVTGTGIELYWLEATYLDRPYVIQVPFSVFKELGDTGIVPVQVEVLYLKDGSKIISYMEIDTEYNSTKKTKK